MSLIKTPLIKNLTTCNWKGAQGLVEFAIIISVILLLLGGTIDFGNLFITYIELLGAAQEGIHFGSYCPDIIKIENRVRSFSDFPVDLNSGEVIVDITFSPDLDVGNTIKIVVIHNDFPFFFPFMEGIFGNKLQAGSSARIMSLNHCP